MTAREHPGPFHFPRCVKCGATATLRAGGADTAERHHASRHHRGRRSGRARARRRSARCRLQGAARAEPHRARTSRTARCCRASACSRPRAPRSAGSGSICGTRPRRRSTGVRVAVAAPDGSGNKAFGFVGKLDAPAQAVDQRMKFSRFMDDRRASAAARSRSPRSACRSSSATPPTATSSSSRPARARSRNCSSATPRARRTTADARAFARLRTTASSRTTSPA